MEYFKRTFQNTYEIKSLFQDTSYYLIQEYHHCLNDLDRANGEDLSEVLIRLKVIEEVLKRLGFEKYNPIDLKEV